MSFALRHTLSNTHTQKKNTHTVTVLHTQDKKINSSTSEDNEHCVGDGGNIASFASGSRAKCGCFHLKHERSCFWEFSGEKNVLRLNLKVR